MSIDDDGIMDQYNKCINLIKYHTNQNYFIGVMNKDLNEFKKYYPKGKLVLYKNNTDIGTLTIELPLDKTKILENISKENYKFTEHQLVNVPKQYIEKLDMKPKIILN